MRKITRKTYGTLSTVLLLLIALPFISAKLKPVSTITPIDIVASIDSAEPTSATVSLYEALNLQKTGLTRSAFNYALKGFEYLKEQNKLQNESILTIVDFSKPSTEKRMYVIDIDQMKVLYRSYVSHGRNSGKLYANRFSNSPESYMSSLGFYVTGGTYSGKHGYSLRLEGEEKGINDNAAKRAIVIHSADYASESFVNNQGYLGRSLGCPALPKNVAKPIIQTIKDGSCLFVYAPSDNYLSKSKIL